MNVSNYTDVPSLHEIEMEYFREKGILGVAFLSILIIVGAVGNTHIFLVYKVSQQMAQRAARILILCLSVVDLIACVVCMPFEIVDIRLNYTFGSSKACSFFRFLTHAVSLSSVALLTAIAIQRFRLVNLPGHTASTNICNIMPLIIIGICTALSVPAFFFYGVDIGKTKFLNVNGTDCTVLSEYRNTIIYGVYGGFMIFVSFCFFIISAVCYGKLLCAMHAQQESKPHRNRNDNNQNQSSSTNMDLSDIRVESDCNTNKELIDILGKRKGYEKGRQLAIGFITTTIISFTGFLIFVLCNVIGIVYPALSTPADNLLSRAFFINNADNAVMIFLLDGIFREECLKLYKKGLKKSGQ